MEQNLLLTLEGLSTVGFGIPIEKRSSLELALAFKRDEANLRTISFWGRLYTENGKDYWLAQGCNYIQRVGYGAFKNWQNDVKNFYSQDGIRWQDLPTLTDDHFAKCKRIQGLFKGKPKAKYFVEDPPPPPPPPIPQEDENSKKEEGQEGEETNNKKDEEQGEDVNLDEGEEENEEEEDKDEEEVEEEDDADKKPKGTKFKEVDRISAWMRWIDEECSVVPLGCMTFNPERKLIKNPYFPGVKFLEKLDSYCHLLGGFENTPLSFDPCGTWSLQIHPFTQDVILQSRLWPGYAFYYSFHSKCYGSLYFGGGEKNLDLAFMV